jgi:hypothetical protein
MTCEKRSKSDNGCVASMGLDDTSWRGDVDDSCRFTPCANMNFFLLAESIGVLLSPADADVVAKSANVVVASDFMLSAVGTRSENAAA